MGTLLIALVAGVGFIIAYHTYGRWLGTKVFELSADAVCPSCRLNDGSDYVPTPKMVVFGHHFTSIAGTGPIVGPAIAIMWGWLPALLWVIFGSIFIGAVHDFGALVVSLRNNGQTVGDIAGRVLNRRVRFLFLLVLFMSLTIVLAIFGLVIAAVFRQYPATIFPCTVQIPIALVIGLWLHRRGVGLLWPSVIALVVMYLTVVYGNWGILHAINSTMAGWSVMTWVVLLLAYSYVASVLPVWMLLQPRDYINSLQLISALGLIVVGLAWAAFAGGAPPIEGAARPELRIVAPLWQFDPVDAPIIFPFLFITIACGAISGFHCLVSSGTSSKQLTNEADARFVGYGSMLTEGFLATLVILACVAGIGLGVTAKDGGVLVGEQAWLARYASWGMAAGLGAKVGAFVDGSANFLKALGVPTHVAVALMGVLVASFAGTTLDTACRLQRYVVQELAATFAPRVLRSACGACGYDLSFNVSGQCPQCQGPVDHGSANPVAQPNGVSINPLVWLTNKHAATVFAVTIAAVIAAFPAPGRPWSVANLGQGGMILWPMFGATNQLLGGLSFLVISFYLWRRGKPIWFLVLPMLFMLVMPAWAMLIQLRGWTGQDSPNYPLIVLAIATLALEVWMIIEAVLLFPKIKGVIEEPPAWPGGVESAAADVLRPSRS